MRVGIPRETTQGERRVARLPALRELLRPCRVGGLPEQEGELRAGTGRQVQLAADGRSLTLAAKPYEIRTVAVTFAPEK